MSIVSGKRSLREIVRGSFNRALQIIAYVSFPYYVTNFLQRLRGVHIGKKAHIARYVYIDDRNPELVHIGNGAAITTGVMILTHERDLKNYKPGMYAMDNPFKEGQVIIGDGAHIGIGSIILPGVIIGEGAVIGAGSVVTTNIPAYTLAVGCPARVIRSFNPEPDADNR